MYRTFGAAGEDERPAIPEWVQQPQDEFPVLMPVGAFLARTEATVISVSHLELYSTGVVIRAEIVVRRRDESERDWSWLLHGGFGRRERTGDELRWSVGFADGSRIDDGDLFATRRWDERPEGPILGMANGSGGGGGGDDRYEQHRGLWLWPLPPAGSIDLGAEWRERGIPESGITLDGDAILAAVPGVQPLWP